MSRINENEYAIKHNDDENVPTVKYNDDDTTENKAMATQIGNIPATEPLNEDLSSINSGQLKITMCEHYMKDYHRGYRKGATFHSGCTFARHQRRPRHLQSPGSLKFTATALTGRTVTLIREMRISGRQTKLAPISANTVHSN